MSQCRGNVAGKWIIEFLLGLDVLVWIWENHSAASLVSLLKRLN